MNVFLQLAAVAILPVLVSILLYYFNEKTVFSNLNSKTKQIIYGIIFGLVAVAGTEFSVYIDGVGVNVRDAAVLCAGLIFGAPAGIIAGIIGGIERFFAVYWGAGTYTQVACSISTFLAGIISALFRRYMFDDKNPSILYAMLISLMTEVLHMMMVFFTNLTDVVTAFGFIEDAAFPMICLCTLSVVMAVVGVKVLSGENLLKKVRSRQISAVFQRWLFLCVLIAFVMSISFTYVLQSGIFKNDTDELLRLNIDDVVDDIAYASDRNLLDITHKVAEEFESNDDVFVIADKYSIAEINVINSDGYIVKTTTEEFMNYNMADGEQSAEFLALLNEQEELVQSYRATSHDSNIYRKYAGVALKDGGFIQVGYDAENFQKDIDTEVVDAAKNRHVGQRGSIIIVDKDWNIVSDRRGNTGQNLYITGLWIEEDELAQNKRFEVEMYGEAYYAMYIATEGYYVVAAIPKSEAIFSRRVSIFLTSFIEIVIFVTLFVFIYIFIKKLVIRNIQKINEGLSKITDGNLDVLIDVRSNEEFSSLSDDINSTVTTLKKYISEAEARIDEELKVAKDIQYSVLPSIFPPYPERDDFEIYAAMYTAKEVGGDFYDFFFVAPDRLAFLIADVSGKGIPAAMFMMSAKTVLKSYAEAGKSVAEAFSLANNKLCENNEQMFVTAWMAIINLKTGELEYANAGHNQPLIRRSSGQYEFLDDRHDLILAGFEDVDYNKHVLTMASGDIIYLYTDGVTEAVNGYNEFYGNERLRDVLSKTNGISSKEICSAVKADVDAFVGTTAQFDDITMLCFEYKGQKENEITVIPTLKEEEYLAKAMGTYFEKNNVPKDIVNKLKVALDEIYSNIVKFSKASYAKVSFGVKDDIAELLFEDDGVEFNPLKQEEADIFAEIEDRPVGGLGIMMVKNLMDKSEYKYDNGKNILKLTKLIKG